MSLSRLLTFTASLCICAAVPKVSRRPLHHGSVTVTLRRGQTSEEHVANRGKHRRKGTSRDTFAPSLYYGQLQVGSPSQNFTVAFDTGSGNLIIPSIGCSDSGCKGHRRYDARLSNTSAAVDFNGQLVAPGKHIVSPLNFTHDEVEISFGEGLLSGTYVSDRICIGGATLCLNASFIAANFESQVPFGTVAYDGVLGLSMPQLAESASYSIVDRMVDAKLLQNSIFSIFFGYDGESSEATFGDYDEGKMASDLFWVPVTTPGFWQVELQDAVVGKEHLKVCKEKSRCQAIVDTGTTFITGPDEMISAISNEVDLKQDCSNAGELPDISFLVGMRALVLKPEDYVLQTKDSCSMAMMPLDIPPPRGPLTILGEPFLRRYFTVYDSEHMRVGFALAKHKVKPPAIEARIHRPLFPKLSKLIQSWRAHRPRLRRHRRGPLSKLQQLLRAHERP